MRNIYEIGRVYIWQNLKIDTHLNGKETTVIGNIKKYQDISTGVLYYAQDTDTPPEDGEEFAPAEEGQLRPKFPPSGEKSISEMFSKPYVKELDKEKELEEAYE